MLGQTDVSVEVEKEKKKIKKKEEMPQGSLFMEKILIWSVPGILQQGLHWGDFNPVFQTPETELIVEGSDGNKTGIFPCPGSAPHRPGGI